MVSNNRGFSAIEVILVVAVLSVIGFVGWKAIGAFSGDKIADIVKTQPVDANQAPTVTDNASLDRSTATLDSMNIDGTEQSQLKSQTNF